MKGAHTRENPSNTRGEQKCFLEDVQRLAREGLICSEIAREIGVDVRRVHDMARRHGVVLPRIVPLRALQEKPAERRCKSCKTLLTPKQKLRCSRCARKALLVGARKRVKARHERLKKQGLCVDCGQNAARKITPWEHHCNRCMETKKERQRERYARDVKKKCKLHLYGHLDGAQ